VEAQVLRRIAAARHLFCFLDFDGTLAPIAPTPDAATPLPGTEDLLRHLARSPGVKIAVVTGRTVADIRTFVDVPGIYYVGIHGLEICLPNGSTDLSEGVAVVRTTLPSMKQQLEQAFNGRPGILIEDKGLALACHYRLAARADAAFALQTVDAVAQTYKRRGVKIAVTRGHEVVEIRPAYANKGKTVCRLLAAQGGSPLAVYIGDDQTDEDAFVLLPADAITIRVGEPPVRTAARYRVDGPTEVQRFLRALVACRNGALDRDASSRQ
jgi:trehalose 6-phosphate phosphatase